MTSRAVVSVLEQNTSTAAGATTVTGNVIAAAARPALYIIHINYVRQVSLNPVAASGVAGAGLTWARWNSVTDLENNTGAFTIYDGAGTGRHGYDMFVAYGTPTGGALTITHGWTLLGTDGLAWQIIKVDNVWQRSGQWREMVNFVNVGSTASSTNMAVTPYSSTVANVTDPYLALVAFDTGTAVPTAGAGATAVHVKTSTNNLGGVAAVTTAAGFSASAFGTYSGATLDAAVIFEFKDHDAELGLLRRWGDATTEVAAGSTIAPGWPSGYTPQADDYAIFVVSGKAYSDALVALTVSAGWTLIAREAPAPASAQARIEVYARVLTGNEVAPTASITNSWANFGNGGAGAHVGVFSGVKTAQPISATSRSGGAYTIGAGVTAGTPPTVSRAEEMIVQILGGYSDSAVMTTDLNAGRARGWRQVLGVSLASKNGAVLLRPMDTVVQPGTPLWYGSPTSSTGRIFLVLTGNPRVYTSSDVIVDAASVDTDIYAEAAGPFLLVDVEVAPVSVSVAFVITRPRPKPRRAILWLYDVSGNRKTALG